MAAWVHNIGVWGRQRTKSLCPCAKFAKAASYRVLLDGKARCKNLRCRKRFDIGGVKTTAFLTD